MELLKKQPLTIAKLIDALVFCVSEHTYRIRKAGAALKRLKCIFFTNPYRFAYFVEPFAELDPFKHSPCLETSFCI